MTDRRKQLQRRLRPEHTVQHSGGGHLKIKDANGATIATIASTPDSERSVTNEEALLRRLGVIEAAHKTVTLDEETVDLVLGAPGRNRQSVASWCHDAIVVGQRLGLRTPRSDSESKAINSLTTQLARLRRERTATRFKPWVAALLIAASEPPGAPQEPPAPQPAPEPIPAAERELEPGTNRARLTRLEELIEGWEGRIAAVEAGLAIVIAQVDEVNDIVTRPNELRGQLAGLLRALMEPA